MVMGNNLILNTLNEDSFYNNNLIMKTFAQLLFLNSELLKFKIKNQLID
jgi:hypothetical protein